MEYVYFILGTFVALLLSSFIHEAGHAVLGWLLGMQPFDFTPYPHIRQGSIYMGYVDFKVQPKNARHEALMHAGSWLFQAGAFLLCAVGFYILKTRGVISANLLTSTYAAVFVGSVLASYAVLSLLDWPMYAVSSSLKKPHFFLYGAPWWDADPYLFAKTLGYEKQYALVTIPVLVWFGVGVGIFYYVISL